MQAIAALPFLGRHRSARASSPSRGWIPRAVRVAPGGARRIGRSTGSGSKDEPILRDERGGAPSARRALAEALRRAPGGLPRCARAPSPRGRGTCTRSIRGSRAPRRARVRVAPYTSPCALGSRGVRRTRPSASLFRGRGTSSPLRRAEALRTRGAARFLRGGRPVLRARAASREGRAAPRVGERLPRRAGGLPARTTRVAVGGSGVRRPDAPLPGRREARRARGKSVLARGSGLRIRTKRGAGAGSGASRWGKRCVGGRMRRTREGSGARDGGSELHRRGEQLPKVAARASRWGGAPLAGAGDSRAALQPARRFARWMARRVCRGDALGCP